MPNRRDTGDLDTHCAPADIALLELPEPVPLGTRLVDLAEGDVHEVVAVDEVAVERLPVLELDELRVRGCAAVSLRVFSPTCVTVERAADADLPWACFARH